MGPARSGASQPSTGRRHGLAKSRTHSDPKGVLRGYQLRRLYPRFNLPRSARVRGRARVGRNAARSRYHDAERANERSGRLGRARRIVRYAGVRRPQARLDDRVDVATHRAGGNRRNARDPERVSRRRRVPRVGVRARRNRKGVRALLRRRGALRHRRAGELPGRRHYVGRVGRTANRDRRPGRRAKRGVRRRRGQRARGRRRARRARATRAHARHDGRHRGAGHAGQLDLRRRARDDPRVGEGRRARRSSSR